MSQPFVTGSAYVRLPRAPETWIVEHLLPAGGKLNCYGSPKSGKSYIILQLAAAIASGAPDWMSFPILTHGPVCYLQIDTPRTLWATRLEDVRLAGIPIDTVHFADGEQAPYPFNILSVEDGYRWLREQVATLHPVVVIIDTIREIHDGDEDSSQQMRNVLAFLEAATRPAGIIIVSHNRKDRYGKDGRPLAEDLLQGNRGSSYIPGRMDAIIHLSRKHLTYKGRTTAEHQLKVIQDPHSGLWKVDESEVDHFIAAVMGDLSLDSQMKKARRLSELTGRTLGSCRRLIQRAETTPHRLQAAAQAGGQLILTDGTPLEIIGLRAQ